MAKSREDKIIVVLAILVGLLLLINFRNTVHQSNASTEHIYHANMIGKTFGMRVNEIEPSGMHHRADRFVDHVGNIQDYNVHTSYTTRHGYEKENVDLIRKHESPYQRKMLALQKRITASLYAN